MASAADIALLSKVHITIDDSEATVMTAVALAESGGNERAHNRNAATRDDSYGLWQINMYGDLGPRRRRQYGLASNAELFDPTRNAVIAGDIYRSQGKAAWGAYRDDRYRRYLSEAEAAVENVPTHDVGGLGAVVDAVSDVIPSSLNPLDDIYRAVTTAVGWLGDGVNWIRDPDNWVRILQVVGGIALGLVAVNIAARPALQQAGGVAATATAVSKGTV